MWNKTNFPELEKQFIVSQISEANNYLKKFYKEKEHYISDTNLPKAYDKNLHHFQTPEQIFIDNQSTKKMSLFLEFLSKRDDEVYRIVSLFFNQGIDLRNEKLLAKKLGVQTCTITNAKRRFQRLRIDFISQHQGDL